MSFDGSGVSGPSRRAHCRDPSGTYAPGQERRPPQPAGVALDRGPQPHPRPVRFRVRACRGPTGWHLGVFFANRGAVLAPVDVRKTGRHINRVQATDIGRRSTERDRRDRAREHVNESRRALRGSPAPAPTASCRRRERRMRGRVSAASSPAADAVGPADGCSCHLPAGATALTAVVVGEHADHSYAAAHCRLHTVAPGGAAPRDDRPELMETPRLPSSSGYLRSVTATYRPVLVVPRHRHAILSAATDRVLFVCQDTFRVAFRVAATLFARTRAFAGDDVRRAVVA